MARTRLILLPALAFASITAGLGSSATAAPPTAIRHQDEASLLFLQQLDQRIADIAWRLGTSNADFCPQRVLSIGLSAHNAVQYAPAYRLSAISAFGFGDGLPAVLAVMKDGPAARAGILPGDRIVAIDGQPVIPERPLARSKEDYGPINAIMSQLENLPDRKVVLDILREQKPLRMEVAPVTICQSRVEIVPGGQMNANANGVVVQIYGKLVLWARNDDELAILIGHEMAHNILNHNRRIHSEGLEQGLSEALGLGSRKLRDLEREADRYGLYLTARAGYDFAQAPVFWRRLSAASGLGNVWATTHPTGAHRAKFNQAVVNEIRLKAAAGGALKP